MEKMETEDGGASPTAQIVVPFLPSFLGFFCLFSKEARDELWIRKTT